jgi:predicted MFS family arabinose efflux permease
MEFASNIRILELISSGFENPLAENVLFVYHRLSGSGNAAQAGTASMYILAIAAFVIVTTEFLMVGLLPALARDLSISIATAGQLVTLFAIVVMFFGPPLTAWLAHVERKRLFMTILALFAVSNAVAALAPNFWVLAVARIIPALALPVFWGRPARQQLSWPGSSAQARPSTVYLGISRPCCWGFPWARSQATPWAGAAPSGCSRSCPC